MKFFNAQEKKGISTALTDAPSSGLEPAKGLDVGQLVPPHRTIDPETDRIVKVPAQVVVDDFGNTAIIADDQSEEPILDSKGFGVYLLEHVKELRLHIPDTPDDKQTLAQATDAFQKAFIQKALVQNHHSIPHTAEALGLTRGGLYKILHRHGLTPSHTTDDDSRDILKNPKPR